MRRQRGRNFIDGSVESIDDGVHFGAQAGRDNDGLLDVRVREQGTENLAKFVLGNRDSL